MVLQYAKANSEASLAGTGALVHAAENVVKAMGGIMKDLELSSANPSLAATTAIGHAAENVVKAVGDIIKQIELNKRRCTSESGSHSFIKVCDNPVCFMCSSCGFRA